MTLFELVSDLGSESWFRQLDAFMQKQVAADRFSGCLLIAQEKTPIFRKAYGFASKRFKIPNQIDTKFNLGSISKIFTKVAIMQLVEQGRLSLGEYISKHLPDYPSDVTSKVTVNHLVNHTSGMGDYFNEKFEASKQKLRTVDDFMGLFINDPLSFEPGKKIQYSNAGYVVLGKIIESISGLDYYDYVRDHIYRPAEMNDSDHYEMDLPVLNLAIGYTSTDDHLERHLEGPRRENSLIIGVRGSPAGGGYSTVDDLLRFSIALQNHKLLNPEYSDLMYLPPALTRTTEIAKPRGFGYAGGAPGVGTVFKMYLDIGYVKAILSNFDPEDMQVIHKKTEDMILSMR